MKTTILIVAAAAMSAAALQAQMPRLTADVPFAFYKGDTPMPAGRYVVRPMGNNTVVLGNSKAKSAVISIFTGRAVTPVCQRELALFLLRRGEQPVLPEGNRGAGFEPGPGDPPRQDRAGIRPQRWCASGHGGSDGHQQRGWRVGGV